MFFFEIIDCLYFQGWVQAHGNASCEGAPCGRVLFSEGSAKRWEERGESNRGDGDE